MYVGGPLMGEAYVCICVYIYIYVVCIVCATYIYIYIYGLQDDSASAKKDLVP